MSTLLITTQILCTGIGVISASLNILRLARTWRETPNTVDDVF